MTKKEQGVKESSGSSAAGAPKEDGGVLAEDESVGAWAEDEEEGTVDTGSDSASQDDRGYQASPEDDAAWSNPAKNDDKPDRSRRRWGSRHDDKQ